MSNLPPVPDGAVVYAHPQQGKTVYVLSDGTMQCYRADGKKATTSATPAKLAAGYGAWEQVEGDTLAPVAVPVPVPAAADYIAPQLAQEAAFNTLRTLVESPEFVGEQKVDGHRVMLVSPGADTPPIALTRNGQPYSRGLPRKLQVLRFPPGNHGDFILDGELVGDTYWVFDLPKSPTTDAATPLHMRRLVLEQLFPHLTANVDGIKLLPQAKTTSEKARLGLYAAQNNFEGLVLKRKSAPYRWGGRTEEWLKIKFVTTADCIVTAVRDDGKDSVALGMVEPGTGGLKIVDVGRASLIGKEKRGAISKGDVIEVRYLYAGAGGRLYQPTILRKRDDKPMHECTTEQMKHVCKDVLEALL